MINVFIYIKVKTNIELFGSSINQYIKISNLLNQYYILRERKKKEKQKRERKEEREREKESRLFT